MAEISSKHECEAYRVNDLTTKCTVKSARPSGILTGLLGLLRHVRAMGTSVLLEQAKQIGTGHGVRLNAVGLA